MYWPGAVLDQLESVTRGTNVQERERESQRAFWGRWGGILRRADVRTEAGMLRVIYVTEDTGVGGGHRDVFEHLNGLLKRGHAAELWTLGGQPDLVRSACPVRTFKDYDELVKALAPVRRDQGRHLVEHSRAGVAGERAARHTRSTSCRTSRPATTRAIDCFRTRSWPRIGTNSGT